MDHTKDPVLGPSSVRAAAPFVESFMDGCGAVQVEDFGLPKSAVGKVGQTSKIFGILNFDFKAVMKTKKTRSARTIILPAVSRRDLCYASENERFRFL